MNTVRSLVRASRPEPAGFLGRDNARDRMLVNHLLARIAAENQGEWIKALHPADEPYSIDEIDRDLLLSCTDVDQEFVLRRALSLLYLLYRQS